ncbi:MAG: methionine--tRNA ligase subunit beta, partial [Schwartzia sp.]|nr:methionine--tRNA ligase subunit beta [Schwartzia sp. (in: firmicutes)]
TIDEFKKTELRVAEVTAAERVPKTDKLLKLTLSLGEENREVVSGIADVYTAEELVGKHVILVANLKPAKLRGIVSHGMVLAASDGEKLRLLETDMPVGSVVR